MVRTRPPSPSRPLRPPSSPLAHAQPFSEYGATGGANGGAAAAVGGRFVPVALAVDTQGDVLAPAALCGVVGFRPTHGRYPRGGVLSLSATLDTVGIIARTVEDVQLVDAVICAAVAAAAAGDSGATSPAGAGGAGDGAMSEEQAAIKMQAVGRGYLQRRRLAGAKTTTDGVAASAPASSAAAVPAPAAGATAAASAAAVDTAEEAHAATRIQALARGRRDRR